MADRYWVGGNGTWNSSDTANWSITSGGSPGASAPTSGDNVFFDDNSGAGGTVVSIGSGAVFYNMYTSRSGTISLSGSSDISCYGTSASTGGSGIFLFSSYTGYLQAFGTSVSIAGQNLWRKIRIKSGATATFNAIDTSDYIENIVMENASSLIMKQDTKVASITGTAVTSIPQIYVGWSGSSDKTLTLIGTYPVLSGYLNISNLFGGKVVMDALLGDSGYSTASAYVQSIELDPSTTGRTFKIGGTSTVGQLSREPASVGFTLQVEPSANLTVESISISGDVSNTINVESSVPGVRAKITKSGGGLVETDYMQVKDMQPAPDNTWISYNSTNLGNNWQWYFDNFNKPTSCLFFGSPA